MVQLVSLQQVLRQRCQSSLQVAQGETVQWRPAMSQTGSHQPGTNTETGTFPSSVLKSESGAEQEIEIKNRAGFHLAIDSWIFMNCATIYLYLLQVWYTLYVSNTGERERNPLLMNNQLESAELSFTFPSLLLHSFFAVAATVEKAMCAINGSHPPH